MVLVHGVHGKQGMPCGTSVKHIARAMEGGNLEAV